MEDFDPRWIFYILAAIFFIFRGRKKKPAQESDYKPFEQEGPTTNKPITFEDLLKEIQQTKQPKQEVVAEKPYKQGRPYIDYDDDLEDEEKNLEKVDYSYRSDDEIYETYEKAKREAFNRPSLEEPEGQKNYGVVRFNHFKEYENHQIPTEAQLIAKELQNPENMKKAVILSEILNRKY